MIDGVRSRNPITCIRPPSATTILCTRHYASTIYLHTSTIQPTTMHLLFTCEQPPSPTTMHLLYTMLHLNRPISTTHIQYQPNTIKYTAPKCSTPAIKRIVLTKVFCLSINRVQVCAKYESVRSICKVCAKYVQSASKLCKYESETWSLPFDQAATLLAHWEDKKRHQKTKKPK